MSNKLDDMDPINFPPKGKWTFSDYLVGFILLFVVLSIIILIIGHIFNIPAITDSSYPGECQEWEDCYNPRQNCTMGGDCW